MNYKIRVYASPIVCAMLVLLQIIAYYTGNSSFGREPFWQPEPLQVIISLAALMLTVLWAYQEHQRSKDFSRLFKKKYGNTYNEAWVLWNKIKNEEPERANSFAYLGNNKGSRIAGYALCIGALYLMYTQSMLSVISCWVVIISAWEIFNYQVNRQPKKVKVKDLSFDDAFKANKRKRDESSK